MASWPLSPSSCHVPSPTAGISPPLFSPKLCANTIFSVDRLLGHLSDHFALQDPQNRLISPRHPQNSQRSWPYTTRRSGQRRSEREPLREAVAYRSGPARPPGCYRSSWRIYIGRGRTCAVEAEEGKSGLGSGEGSQHASTPASQQAPTRPHPDRNYGCRIKLLPRGQPNSAILALRGGLVQEPEIDARASSGDRHPHHRRRVRRRCRRVLDVQGGRQHAS